jgi:hypothetical protein
MTGRIQIVGRLPVALNRRVRAAAHRRQVSLNAFLIEALTQALGPRHRRRRDDAPRSCAHAGRRRDAEAGRRGLAHRAPSIGWRGRSPAATLSRTGCKSSQA